MKYFCYILLSLIIINLLGCGKTETPLKISLAQSTEPASGEQILNKKHIKLAIASVISPNKAFKYYEEMINYLSKKSNQPIKLIQRESYREINDLIKLGKVDIAFVCSGAYTQGVSESYMELLVAPQVMSKTVYYSYIIVQNSAESTSIKDLKGKSFAFTDPLSNSGYLSPNYLLLTQSKETADTFFSDIKFTYSHDLSIKAVALGKVHSAAVDSLVYDYLRKTEPELIARTKIIHISEPYGIPPVVVHPKLTPELKTAFEDIFLNMHNDPQGKEILDRLMIDKFVEIKDELYDSIRNMQKALQIQ